MGGRRTEVVRSHTLSTRTGFTQVIPENQEELQEGDIISFETDYGTIIHRIIKIDYDKEGWYAITKGDNSPVNDSEKVRFTQIKRVVVAIIY